MAWWRDARFGMFVHWGLYSGLAGTWDGKPVATSGGMEWIQERVKADTDTYAKRAIPLFNPKPGFAREWARIAKGAGARYVVFTTKHHDGFALHDSAVSDYDAGSVLHRDLVKEIVEALRAEGLRVGFYHSVIDWHHDQYEYGALEAAAAPARRHSRIRTASATTRSISSTCTREVERTAVELRPRGHHVVGLQRAGLPGPGGMACLRPDAAARSKQPEHHHEQPAVPYPRGGLEEHGDQGYARRRSTRSTATSSRPSSTSPPPACPVSTGRRA